MIPIRNLFANNAKSGRGICTMKFPFISYNRVHETDSLV